MEAIINITGVIGEDFTIKDLIVALEKNKDATSYRFMIDSIGGYVNEGFAIARYIENLEVPTVSEGREVYSIANIIYFSTDKREYNEATEFMLHNAWVGPAFGNKEDLREIANDLEKTDQQIRNYISLRTGLSDDTLKALMSRDTFISGDEAKELGFYNKVRTLAFAAMATKEAANKFKIELMAKDKNKEAKSVLSQLAQLLGVNQAKPEAKNMTFELEGGGEIFVETEDGILEGKSTPAEDGTYTLADGRRVVVVDGTITEVQEMEEETAMDDELIKENEELKARITELEGKLAGMEEEKAKSNEMEEEYNALKEREENVLAIAKHIQSHREKFPNNPLFNQQHHNTEADPKHKADAYNIQASAKDKQKKDKYKTY